MNEKKPNILDVLSNPSLLIKFDMTQMVSIGLTIFVAITLSGLAVEGIKRIFR